MGKTPEYFKRLEMDLKQICVNIEDRHVGSNGNQLVSNYISKRLTSAGFEVLKPAFKCIDWEYERCIIKVVDENIHGFISPYSNPCDVKTDFETAKSIDELQNKVFKGKIAVLHGELCKEQIMPKNFVFYNPKEHQQIVKLLEEKSPVAIVAITGKNNELAADPYPFPLFEDGDFHIPNVYVTEKEGKKILQKKGKGIRILIKSKRIDSDGYNVIGIKKGLARERLVFCAHSDSKKGSPGALDNGTGLAILLMLGDRLKDYRGKYTIEIVALNGEDYYSNPGQMLYLEQNKDKFEEILLAVNCDGAAYYKGKTTYSTFKLDTELSDIVEEKFSDSNAFLEVENWYQSDHMIFVMNGVPAIAITSEYINEIASEIAHTPQDTIDKINLGIISKISDTLMDLIASLNENY